MNTKTIKLDINKKSYETITAKQGDTKSRFILFNLYDGPIQFDLTGRTVRVYGEKRDNTTIFNDLVINDAKKGYCTLELTNQMLAVEGMIELELVIFEGEKRLSTMPFILNVVGSKYSEDALASANEFTALSNALKTVGEIDNKADKKEVEKISSQLDTVVRNTLGKINVKQFKCDDGEYVKGDYKHDDTTGIKRALQYIKDNYSTCNVLFFPAGCYLISETIEIPSGCILEGSGRPVTRQVGGTMFRRNSDIIMFSVDGTNSSYENPFINNQFKNIGFNDLGKDYINPQLKLKKLHYFLIENCIFYNGMKQLDLEGCFDSRILNTDFQSGGYKDNSLAAVNLVDSESSLDVNNQIIFENCRFEYYSYKGLYIGKNNNEIWLKSCKFESKNINGDIHLDFNTAGTIYLDVQICGRQNDTMINFYKTNHINGFVKFEHTWIDNNAEFNTPIIKSNNCKGILLDLQGDLNSLYSLDYLIEDVNSSFYDVRTDIDKKIFNRDIHKTYNGRYKTNGKTNGLISQVDNKNDYWVTGSVIDEGDSTQWRIFHNKAGEITIPIHVANNGDIYLNKNVICKGTLIPYTSNTRPWGTNGLTYVDTTNSIRKVCTAINNNWINISKNSAIPTDGTWTKGDIIYNSNPTAGSYIGWVCTSDGTPGTWKGFGLISN